MLQLFLQHDKKRTFIAISIFAMQLWSDQHIDTTDKEVKTSWSYYQQVWLDAKTVMSGEAKDHIQPRPIRYEAGAGLHQGASGDISHVSLFYNQPPCATVFEKTLHRGCQKSRGNMFS